MCQTLIFGGTDEEIADQEKRKKRRVLAKAYRNLAAKRFESGGILQEERPADQELRILEEEKRRVIFGRVEIFSFGCINSPTESRKLIAATHLAGKKICNQDQRGFFSALAEEINPKSGGVVMLPATSEVKVYVALGVTDMRKSINGLSLLVEEHFQMDLFSGNLFAFCNRRRDRIKIIYWDHNGFCLWMKRLEKEVFRWPESEREVIEISQKALSWLLHGLDLRQAHQRLSYSSVS